MPASSPSDVDVIYVGNMNGGFVRQEFHSSLALQAHPDLRFKPATRVENACATGSAAIHMGLNTPRRRQGALRAGGRRREDDRAQPAPARRGADQGLLRRRGEPISRRGFAGIFGKITSAYFQRYGDKSDALAKIAVKAHKNGVTNPYAHLPEGFRLRVLPHPSDKNPFVAGPLKRTDCSPVTDGAAAVVLADVETALGMKQAVAFRAAEHVNDFLPMSKRDIIKFEGPHAGLEAGAGRGQARPATISPCREPRLLHLGRADRIRGDGPDRARRGRARHPRRLGRARRQAAGQRPGGLKAKGHPVGATGVCMHVMSAMQLSRRSAGGMQLAEGQARRRVQHGRRRGRQLCQHSRAAAVGAVRAHKLYRWPCSALGPAAHSMAWPRDRAHGVTNDPGRSARTSI